MDRANNQDKRPIIIEDISDVQKVSLHGETLLTAVVILKGSMPMYFVSKGGAGDSYLDGGEVLLTEIDTDGFNAVVDQIHKEKGEKAKTEEAKTYSLEEQAKADAKGFYQYGDNNKLGVDSSEGYKYSHQRAATLGYKGGEEAEYAVAFRKELNRLVTSGAN